MNCRWLAYLLCTLGLISFGYGCKGGGSSEPSYITVLLTQPESGATEVPVLARIGFRVDADIDEATLSEDTFYLTDEDGAVVPSTVVIGADDPATAELTPEQPLSVLTQFTLTVTTGLLSTDGRSLEEDYEWRFTTLDSAWGTSQWLEETGTGTASQAQIAVDGALNAIAAWQYEDLSGAGTFIYANRYTRTDLWGDPVQIDSGLGAATNPKVAADDAGNGFAVWQRSDDGGSTTNIWSNRSDTNGVWGTPELLQNVELTPARNPSVAADPSGNAIAVWAQRDLVSGNELVWAIRYEPGAGWGVAEPIDPMPAPLVGASTAVGMDDEGNAIAVWARQTVGGNVLWANRYTPGSGWGTAELIKSDTETSARDERLDVGPSGDAFVVWVQDQDGRDDIWAVRFSGSAWEAPLRLDDWDGGPKRLPDVAVDGSGVAHAVWSQADLDFANIWASAFAPESGWDAPELIEPPNEDPTQDSDATSPRIDANAAGNVFVVWRQNAASWGSIWSNRLDPGTGWMTAQTIEKIDRPAGFPNIAVDVDRHAHAVWPHSEARGVDWVRTNRFE
ncbi:MAG: Ig-like domain-containing protein [Polyangiales bacterium]